MKGRKFVSMTWAVLTAAALWATPVWAVEQDTGYPWFGDIIEESNQTIPQPNTTFRLTPVLPSKEDTGYPWFADIEKDDQTIMKPIEVFGVHPRSTEEDSGYPWHADTKDDNPTSSEHKTTTQ